MCFFLPNVVEHIGDLVCKYCCGFLSSQPFWVVQTLWWNHHFIILYDKCINSPVGLHGYHVTYESFLLVYLPFQPSSYNQQYVLLNQMFTHIWSVSLPVYPRYIAYSVSLTRWFNCKFLSYKKPHGFFFVMLSLCFSQHFVTNLQILERRYNVAKYSSYVEAISSSLSNTTFLIRLMYLN